MAAAAAAAAAGSLLNIGQGLMGTQTRQISRLNPLQDLYFAMQAQKAMQYMPGYYKNLQEAMSGDGGAIKKMTGYATDYNKYVGVPDKTRYQEQLSQVANSIHGAANQALENRSSAMMAIRNAAQRNINQDRSRVEQMSSDANMKNRQTQAAAMALGQQFTPMGQAPENIIRQGMSPTSLAASGASVAGNIGSMIADKVRMSTPSGGGYDYSSAGYNSTYSQAAPISTGNIGGR